MKRMIRRSTKRIDVQALPAATRDRTKRKNKLALRSYKIKDDKAGIVNKVKTAGKAVLKWVGL